VGYPRAKLYPFSVRFAVRFTLPLQRFHLMEAIDSGPQVTWAGSCENGMEMSRQGWIFLAHSSLI